MASTTPSAKRLPWLTEEDVIKAWLLEFRPATKPNEGEKYSLPDLILRAEGLMGTGKVRQNVLTALLRKNGFTNVVRDGFFYWVFVSRK